MRITSVDIPQKSINNGLEPVKMDRLSQIVILVGKNGSGKTRLLNLIASTIKNKPPKSVVDKMAKKKFDAQNSIGTAQTNIEKYEKLLKDSINEDQKKSYMKSIEKQINKIKQFESEILKTDSTLNWKLIVTDTILESYIIVPFIPKELDVKDANSYPKSDLLRIAHGIDPVGVDQLSTGTFARIQIIQDRKFTTTHPDSVISDSEKEKAIKEYKNLQDLIRIFLNTELDRNIDGEATIFGFPLGQANLSNGQKVLIQFCLAIH
jgi:energy-coupling factor transporter ATP-binding protein EcfA2